MIGHVDVVLLSNSTWIDEDDPCVVFGMRGVLHASLEVSSGISDAHSGVDGGAVAEPMFDMVRVLGAIGGQDGIKLPHFCTSCCVLASGDTHRQMIKSDLNCPRKWLFYPQLRMPLGDQSMISLKFGDSLRSLSQISQVLEQPTRPSFPDESRPISLSESSPIRYAPPLRQMAK